MKKIVTMVFLILFGIGIFGYSEVHAETVEELMNQIKAEINADPSWSGKSAEEKKAEAQRRATERLRNDPSAYGYTAAEVEDGVMKAAGFLSLEAFCDEYCDCVFGYSIMSHVMGIYTPNESAVEQLKFVDSDGNDDFTAFTVVNVGGIFGYFCIFGVMMTLAFFLIELNKTVLMTGGEFSMKQFFAPFIKFALAVFVIVNISSLAQVYAGFNNNFISKISDAMQGIGDTNSGPVVKQGETWYFNTSDPQFQKFVEIGASVEDQSMMDRLGIMFNLSLVDIGATIASLVIIYQAISRKIEMVLRTAFLPITAGDIYEGSHSGLVKYFKKMLALLVAGGGMLLVIAIGSSIQMTNMGTDLSMHSLLDMAMIVLIPLAEAGMCATVKSVCNDAFGV